MIQKVVGELVLPFKGHKNTFHRAGLAAHQQFHLPGSRRVKLVTFAYDEDGHFGKVGHAFGVHVIQSIVIHIAKTDLDAVLA